MKTSHQQRIMNAIRFVFHVLNILKLINYSEGISVSKKCFSCLENDEKCKLFCFFYNDLGQNSNEVKKDQFSIVLTGENVGRWSVRR